MDVLQIEKLMKKIDATQAVMMADMKKNVAGNKSAGVRARKISTALAAMYKEYRKLSVA